ncbi:MAG: hypothetical protein K5920_03105 [Bacteroidales bacterium]|nr:hypothetical protein [Bacteroidales bacterium]
MMIMDKQKSYQIRLLSVDENQVLNYLGNRSIDGLNEETLVFQFKLDTKLKLINRMVAIRTAIKYVFEEKDLLQVENTLAFEVDRLEEIVTKNEENGTLSFSVDILPTFISVAFGTLRGMVYKETKGTVLENYPIPLISMETLKEKNVIVVEE